MLNSRFKIASVVLFSMFSSSALSQRMEKKHFCQSNYVKVSRFKATHYYKVTPLDSTYYIKLYSKSKGDLILTANNSYINLSTKSGYFIYFDNSRKIKEEGNYSDDMRQGFWRFYDDYLKETISCQYDKGKLNGDWKKIDSTGQIIEKKVYEQNILIIEYILKTDSLGKEYYETREQARFEGGYSAFYEYIKNKIVLTDEIIDQGLQGNVYVRFKLDTTGKICDVIIVKGVHRMLDKAVLSAFKDLPLWTPAKVNGEGVNIYITIPINISIN
jgi:TonB family protein